jgi:hypothetical protein
MVRYNVDFVHRLNYEFINRDVSEAGFCFCLQVKKGGRGQKTYLPGPLVELVLVQVNQGTQHIHFLASSLLFYLVTKTESSFRNVVIL